MIFRLPENIFYLLIVAGLSLFLSVSAFLRRKNNLSAGILSIVMFTSAFWTLFYILELAAVTEKAQLFANDLAYIPIVAIPILLLMFIITATGRTDIINLKTVPAMFILPVIILVLIWTSEHHNLFYKSIYFVPDGNRSVMTIERGLFYWVNIAYSYLCLLSGTIIAFNSFVRSSGVFRKQTAILAAGIILPWIGSLIDIFYGTIAGIHAMQASFVFCGLIFMRGIIRFQFTNISPVGRHELVDRMENPMLVIDQNHTVVDLNNALLKYSGGTAASILGKPLTEAFPEQKTIVDEIKKLQIERRVKMTMQDEKNNIHFTVRKVPLFSGKKRELGTLIMFTDITERIKTEQRLTDQLEQIKILQRELQEQAIRDPLTGLYNRRFLEEILQQHFARIKRGTGSIGILFIDIDDFKIYNDTYGHQTGDEVLVQLSKILSSNIRESDAACRYGGEEFMIIFLDTDINEIYNKAEIMRKRFEENSFTFLKPGKYISFSAGIASCPQDAETVEETITLADSALYRAKTRGKNCIVKYGSDPTE